MIENDKKFYSISSELQSTNVGLIFESSFDIEFKINLKRFYFAMGDSNGNSIIFQRLITKDEILSNLKREIENEKSKEILSILSSMKTNPYNPMNYNSEFYQKVETIITKGTLIEKKKTTKKIIPQTKTIKKPIVLKKITNLK